MYLAKGNQVYYYFQEDCEPQLFLTVHLTESSISLENQATQLAIILNKLPVKD